MIIAVAAVGVLLAGCTSVSSQARLTQLETQADADDEVIADLSERVAAFERTVDDLVALYDRASDALMATERKFGLAQQSGDASSRHFQQAASEYEAAAKNWRLVTISLLLAANWDYAGHLCDTRMTTASYRKMLRNQGIELEGLDADHGLPKSLGGADHSLNYQMIDSSLNRSLGNDVMRKLMVHPLHVLRGGLVSALMRLRCSPQL